MLVMCACALLQIEAGSEFEGVPGLSHTLSATALRTEQEQKVVHVGSRTVNISIKQINPVSSRAFHVFINI